MSSEKELHHLRQDKLKNLAKGDYRSAAEVCNYLGHKYRQNGQIQDALMEHMEELKLCRDKVKDDKGIALAHRCLAEVYAEKEEYTPSLTHLSKYMSLAQRMKDEVEQQRAFTTFGRVYLMQGDLVQAEKSFQCSLKLADRVQNKVKESEYAEMKCGCYLNMGLICEQRNQLNEGCKFNMKAITIATKYNLKETLHRCQYSLALMHQNLKCYTRALKLMDGALTTVKGLKDRVFLCEYLIAKGHLLILSGDYVRARKTFLTAVSTRTPIEEDISKAQAKYDGVTLLLKAVRALAQLDPGKKIDSSTGELSPSHISSFTPQTTSQILGLFDRMGDIAADQMEAYSVSADFYRKELALARSLGKPDSFQATILASIAQSLLDDKQLEASLNTFKQELVLREGNPIEQTKTTLKIIEVYIDMKCKSITELESMYDSALVQFSGWPKCRRNILKDYISFLKSEQDVGSVDKIETLKRLMATIPKPKVGEEGDDPEEEDSTSQSIAHISLGAINISSCSSDSEDGHATASLGVGGSMDPRVGIARKRKNTKQIKRNDVGETPLHRACIENDLKRVNKLLATGHQVDPEDNAGWKPLHEACNFGFLPIVQALLDAGANINDPGGKLSGNITPLHDACSNYNLPVIKLLLERDADVTPINDEGETALDCLWGWRNRIKEPLTDLEEEEFLQLVQSLERKMKESGFDVAAERNRPRIVNDEVSGSLVTKKVIPRNQLKTGQRSRPIRNRRNALYDDDLPSGQVDASSPPSSPARKRPTHSDASSSSYSALPNLHDPEVARNEYKDMMKSLRRKVTFDSDSEEENESTRDRGAGPSLVNDTQRQNFDEWLVDDVGIIECRNSSSRKEGTSTSRPKKSSTQPSGGRRRVNSSNDMSRPLNRVVTLDSDSETFMDADMDPPKRTDHLMESSSKWESGPLVPHSVSTTLGKSSSSSTFSAVSSSLKEETMKLIKVRLESKTFLIKVSSKDTISWLARETANRYFQLEKKKPIIILQTTDQAILSNEDLVLDMVIDNEVIALVQQFEVLSLDTRYKESAISSKVTCYPDIEMALKGAELSGLLNLSYFRIPQHNVKVLSDSLIFSEKITSVDFSFIDLSCQLDLLNLMKDLPKLKQLRLMCCGLTGQEVSLLSDMKLPVHIIDLSYNPLGDGAIMSLSTLLSSGPVQSINLIGCDMSSLCFKNSHFTRSISDSLHLTSLQLDDTSYPKEEVKSALNLDELFWFKVKKHTMFL